MRDHSNPILISGGGIAGLTLARALHLRGVPALALEKRVSGADTGLAINLSGNAVAALRHLGLGADVDKIGRPIKHRKYFTDRGQLLFAVNEDEFWGAEARPRALLRCELLSLLSSNLPNEMVRHGAEIISADQNRLGVEVKLSDGTWIQGRALIGADGVRSTVRRTCFENEAPAAAVLSRESWRFMIPNPGVECWTLWAGKASMLLLMPVGNERAYGWATTFRHLQGIDTPALRGAFQNFPDLPQRAIASALEGVDSIYRSPIEEVRTERWSVGRILLIGDAAHATAPIWAQGAALAMEDAITLSRLITGGESWAALSQKYEMERRPRVEHVRSMTDRLSRAAKLPTFLRNWIMPIVGPRSYASTYGPLRSFEG